MKRIYPERMVVSAGVNRRCGTVRKDRDAQDGADPPITAS
jgi:hypothetical protein